MKVIKLIRITMDAPSRCSDVMYSKLISRPASRYDKIIIERWRALIATVKKEDDEHTNSTANPDKTDSVWDCVLLTLQAKSIIFVDLVCATQPFQNFCVLTIAFTALFVYVKKNLLVLILNIILSKLLIYFVSILLLPVVEDGRQRRETDRKKNEGPPGSMPVSCTYSYIWQPCFHLVFGSPAWHIDFFESYSLNSSNDQVKCRSLQLSIWPVNVWPAIRSALRMVILSIQFSLLPFL